MKLQPLDDRKCSFQTHIRRRISGVIRGEPQEIFRLILLLSMCQENRKRHLRNPILPPEEMPTAAAKVNLYEVRHVVLMIVCMNHEFSV